MATNVAIDFETYLISKEHPIPKPVCLSYHNGTQTGLLVTQISISTYLNSILTNTDTIIAHNTTFEQLVIYKWFPSLRDKLIKSIKEGRWFCTMIYEKLLTNTQNVNQQRFDLASLVEKYFHKDISECKTDPNSWRLRYSELDGIPLVQWPKEAISYAEQDSVYAFELHKKQQSISSIPYSHHINTSFCLNLTGKDGFLIDQSRVACLKAEIIAKLKPYYDILQEKDFVYINKKGKWSKRLKQLQTHVKASVRRLQYTAKGGISTSGESLLEYLNEVPDDVVIQAFAFIGKYEKALSAYIHRMELADPYIYYNYGVALETGRTSSSTDMNFPSLNIQQITRALK